MPLVRGLVGATGPEGTQLCAEVAYKIDDQTEIRTGFFYIKEMLSAEQAVDILIIFGTNAGAQLLGSWLYDKISKRKGGRLEIEGVTVELDKEKIEKLLISKLRTELDALTAFYRQQWDDLYHQDSLDWRVMAVLLTVVGAFSAIITYAQGSIQPLPRFGPFFLMLGLVAFSLAFYGVWMTSRSWLNLQFKMANIRNAERAMNIERLVNERTEIPRSASRFLSRFARSRRFPLLFVYLLTMAVPLSVLLSLLLSDTVLVTILSLLIAASCVIVALGVQTSDYLHRFKSPKSILES